MPRKPSKTRKGRAATRARRPRAAKAALRGGHRIGLSVNGKRQESTVESRVLLVDYLRDRLKLKGTHVGCDTSQCGACTVLVDGRAVKSCTMFAVQADGSDILTIEGLAIRGHMDPVQEAFKANQGLQCGFCTPGVVLAAYAFLQDHAKPTEEEVRTAIAGNLCRCTGYQAIVRSVLDAAQAGS